MQGVKIIELKKYSDERGWLAEIYRNDELDYKPAMAYASVTKPGVSRGPHEHKEQSDLFVFAGPGDFELYLWDRREDSSTKGESLKLTAGATKPMAVLVPPGVVHGYKCVSQEPGFSLNLPDKLYKGYNKQEEIDEIRWEDKEDSPYKIN